MDLGLRNCNVLITGGSKGIGFACAKVFQAEGARIALVSRSQRNLDTARRSLGEAYTVAADLTDAAAAMEMVGLVEAKFGPVDVLVNSAGAARRTKAEDLEPSVWRSGMDSKYFSYINVIDPVIKLMATRGSGTIVNIIGDGGKFPSSSHLPGGAANAALMLITAGLANTYAARGVRVVGVNPGPVNTERVAERLRVEAERAGISETEVRKRVIKALPQGRFAEPVEIAYIVVFASSDRGRYLAGANITANGAASTAVV